jgi:hypothetical protein
MAEIDGDLLSTAAHSGEKLEVYRLQCGEEMGGGGSEREEESNGV